MLLRYRPPYDWPAMLSFLRARAIPGIERVSGESYARTIEIDGTHGTLRVQPGDPTRAREHDALRVVIRFPNHPPPPAIIARLRRVFDLDADPATIGAHLEKDPALAPLVAARPGLRVPGAWEGFELAIRAVLGQQITVTAAVGLAGKLVAAYGTPIAVAASDDPALTHVFPRPERLADADLSTLGMPRARAAALSAIAAAVVRDAHLFDPKRTLDDAIAQLRALDGIGEWTAHYIAMRAMREPDAFPAADIGLLRAMADTTGRRPNPRDLLARAERWRPWRAYAAQHLWSAAAATAGAGAAGAAPTNAAGATSPTGATGATAQPA